MHHRKFRRSWRKVVCWDVEQNGRFCCFLQIANGRMQAWSVQGFEFVAQLTEVPHELWWLNGFCTLTAFCTDSLRPLLSKYAKLNSRVIITYEKLLHKLHIFWSSMRLLVGEWFSMGPDNVRWQWSSMCSAEISVLFIFGASEGTKHRGCNWSGSHKS